MLSVKLTGIKTQNSPNLIAFYIDINDKGVNTLFHCVTSPKNIDNFIHDKSIGDVSLIISSTDNKTTQNLYKKQKRLVYQIIGQGIFWQHIFSEEITKIIIDKILELYNDINTNKIKEEY